MSKITRVCLKRIQPAIDYKHVEIPVVKARPKKLHAPHRKRKTQGIPTGHEVGRAWDMHRYQDDEWTEKIAEAGASYKNGMGMGHEQASGPGE